VSAPGRGRWWAAAFFAVGAGVVLWGLLKMEPSVVAIGAGLLGAPGLRESLSEKDEGNDDDEA
jgi:hypothetical protein